MNPSIEIYRDTAGEYRWRRRAANGQVVAGPQEGYTRKRAAIRAAVRTNRDIHPRDMWDHTKGYPARVRSTLLDGLRPELGESTDA